MTDLDRMAAIAAAYDTQFAEAMRRAIATERRRIERRRYNGVRDCFANRERVRGDV